MLMKMVKLMVVMIIKMVMKRMMIKREQEFRLGTLVPLKVSEHQIENNNEKDLTIKRLMVRLV